MKTPMAGSRRRGILAPLRPAALLALVLLGACSGLGREINQALPAFLRSDPGREEMEIFERVRRLREWTPEDLADQDRRVAEIEEHRRNRELGSMESKIKGYLEIYPASVHDEDLRFLLAETFYLDDEWRSAFRQYREFGAIYPLSPHGPAVVERIYEMGRSYLAGERSTFFGIFSQKSVGIEMLEHLIETYPKSRRASDSQYALARHRMDVREWSQARADFRFLHEQYRESEWAPSALFYDAYCSYRQVKGSVYDPKTMGEAVRSFERYLAQVEDGEFERDARTFIAELRELQAEHMFRVGDWYAGAGKPYSSRFYFLSVLTRHPESGAAARARARLADLEERGLIGEPLVPPEGAGGEEAPDGSAPGGRVP